MTTYKLTAEFELNTYYLKLTQSQITFLNWLDNKSNVCNEHFKLTECNEEQEYEDLTTDSETDNNKVVLTSDGWYVTFLNLNNSQLMFLDWLLSHFFLYGIVGVGLITEEIEFVTPI